METSQLLVLYFREESLKRLNRIFPLNNNQIICLYVKLSFFVRVQNSIRDECVFVTGKYKSPLKIIRIESLIVDHDKINIFIFAHIRSLRLHNRQFSFIDTQQP